MTSVKGSSYKEIKAGSVPEVVRELCAAVCGNIRWNVFMKEALALNVEIQDGGPVAKFLNWSNYNRRLSTVSGTGVRAPDAFADMLIRYPFIKNAYANVRSCTLVLAVKVACYCFMSSPDKRVVSLAVMVIQNLLADVTVTTRDAANSFCQYVQVNLGLNLMANSLTTSEPPEQERKADKRSRDRRLKDEDAEDPPKAALRKRAEEVLHHFKGELDRQKAGFQGQLEAELEAQRRHLTSVHESELEVLTGAYQLQLERELSKQRHELQAVYEGEMLSQKAALLRQTRHTVAAGKAAPKRQRRCEGSHSESDGHETVSLPCESPDYG